MFSLDLVKAAAIVLVTNSHMREFYPIREVATGGILGNSLFFFSAAFAATLSLSKRPTTFFSWYLKRVKRIYPQLWLTMFVLIAVGFITVHGLTDFILKMMFPGEYWFLPAIAALYIPVYFVIANFTVLKASIVFGLAAVGYLWAYVLVVDPSKWNVEDYVLVKSLFYLMVMISGVLAAKLNRPPRSGCVIALRFVLITITFFGFLAFLKAYELYLAQGIANAIALAWVLAFFQLASVLSKNCRLQSWFGKPVTFLSGFTLEIYLAQVPLVASTDLQQLAFPLNVAVVLTAIFSIALLLRYSLTGTGTWLNKTFSRRVN